MENLEDKLSHDVHTLNHDINLNKNRRPHVFLCILFPMLSVISTFIKCLISLLSACVSYMLGEIESDHLTVSNSEIITLDFHCL